MVGCKALFLVLFLSLLAIYQICVVNYCKPQPRSRSSSVPFFYAEMVREKVLEPRFLNPKNPNRSVSVDLVSTFILIVKCKANRSFEVP